jgi:hypothetical protein
MLPTRKTRGFTLIATLMLLLMSGIAIGLLTIWGGQTLNYKGSMASLYYSTYSTGRDKNDGNTTYDPRLETTSSIIFDHLFTQPQNLARNAVVP